MKRTAKYINKYSKYDELIRFLKDYPDIEESALNIVNNREKFKKPSLQLLVRKILKAFVNKKKSHLFLGAIYFCSKE